MTTAETAGTIKTATSTTSEFPSRIIHGNCLSVLPTLPARSVNLVVTDPPYIARYRSRDGRSLAGDDNDRWLRPAFAELYRVLERDSFCVSFYGWPNADRFLAAWRSAGFRPVAHLVFVKRYASARRFVRYQHEQAYVLAKGRPDMPREPIADVIAYDYTGNRLHPTQKPVSALTPLVRAFSRGGDIVLDPFAGSGSSLVAASLLKRRYLGIELDARYHAAAAARLRRECRQAA